jgi:hypothetical protein
VRTILLIVLILLLLGATRVNQPIPRPHSKRVSGTRSALSEPRDRTRSEIPNLRAWKARSVPMFLPSVFLILNGSHMFFLKSRISFTQRFGSCDNSADERSIHEVAVTGHLRGTLVRQVAESHGPIGKETLLEIAAQEDKKSMVPEVAFNRLPGDGGVPNG